MKLSKNLLSKPPHRHQSPLEENRKGQPSCAKKEPRADARYAEAGRPALSTWQAVPPASGISDPRLWDSVAAAAIEAAKRATKNSALPAF